MSEEPAALASLLAGRGEEVAVLWRGRHLEAVALASDRRAVERAHARGSALLEALGRALGSPQPGDWGAFTHREAVQIGTMMAWSLAEDRATPTAVGALVPALGEALEALSTRGASGALLPLASVVAEGYATAVATEQSLAEQRRLGAGTPVLALPGGTVLVAAVGRPEAEAAAAVVDRATRLALGLERPSVVVDLTHLDGASPAALAAFVGFAEDVTRLRGRCLLVGLTEERAGALEGVGLASSSLEVRSSLVEALAELSRPRGILQRLRQRLP